jgi:hypothetical protein
MMAHVRTYLKDGHVLKVMLLIHGVIVDAMDTIQFVMIQMLHYGKTVKVLLHVMLHKQNVLNLNLMIAAEYPVVITLLVADLAM